MLVILSSGRSGTNLFLECFTDHPNYKATDYPEDKLLFKRGIEYPKKYLSKCDTNYIENYQEFYNFMNVNKHCHILWTIRHPYSWVISKLYRGRPTKSRGYKPADDATVDGCIADFEHMYNIYSKAIKDFPFRILTVKLEDLLIDIEKEIRYICNWLNISFLENMTSPHLRMRHKGKKDRYNKIDKSQINVHERIDSIYNGYFAKRRRTLNKIFDSGIINKLIKEFKYE